LYGRSLGRGSFLFAPLAIALAGCNGGTTTRTDTQADDLLPAFAVAAKPHVGSLAAHSFTREGSDRQPAPAPDGSWFAFASTRNSSEPQIYRQPSSGSVVTQLTQGPSPHAEPAVSPAGNEIAIAGRDSGSWDIWIIPADGGPRENLTSTPDIDESSPTWHPSGKALAYNCLRSQGDEHWICAKSRGSSGVSWITAGHSPSWSPAGDLIAFRRAKQRGRKEYSLWIVKVDVDQNGLVSGGAESQVVSNPSWGIANPAFSPDGQRIAFTAVSMDDRSTETQQDAEGDIWCVRTDGTDLIRLTNTPEPDWDPAWAGSPENTKKSGRLFFSSERNGHMNVWSLLPALSGQPGLLAPLGF
jgi:TolB protein